MKNRIFGTLHPFFEDGPINGRKQANAGFMTALLTVDTFAEYHFFVANPPALQAQWKTLEHLPAIARGAVHAWHRTKLTDALQKNPYYVFHFSDPVSGFVELCEQRNHHSPHIFPVTSVNHSINYQSFAIPFLAHCWGGSTPRDAIGANSHAAKNVLHAWFTHLQTSYALDPARCPAPDIRVIPMGVDPNTLPRPAEETQCARHNLRHSLGMAENTVMLLLFGRISLDDKMDPQPLLMAMHRVRSQYPTCDVRLVIAGYATPHDPILTYLEAVARALHVPLHILPTPSVEEKFALYAAADIFLSPSDNIQETFGLTLIEAACAQLPVIASDWDGYRDIVQHGHTGLLIPTWAAESTPQLDSLASVLFDNQHQFLRAQRTAIAIPALATAIYNLATQPEKRQNMGQAARTHALSYYTWEHVTRQWLDFWQELHDRPLADAIIQHVRTLRHPLRLPFGRVFAPYASHALTLTSRVQCTRMGHSLREKRVPWEVLGKAPGINKEHLHAVLVLARKPIDVGTLGERLHMEEESLCTHVLWALKHDLLIPL